MIVLFEIVIIIVSYFLVDLFTYKYIRHLDKKERAKLAEKETKYLKDLIEKMNKPTQESNNESEIDLLDN